MDNNEIDYKRAAEQLRKDELHYTYIEEVFNDLDKIVSTFFNKNF